jgi:hypothetical protein
LAPAVNGNVVDQEFADNVISTVLFSKCFYKVYEVIVEGLTDPIEHDVTCGEPVL